jgi:hypothetical protein
LFLSARAEKLERKCFFFLSSILDSKEPIFSAFDIEQFIKHYRMKVMPVPPFIFPLFYDAFPLPGAFRKIVLIRLYGLAGIVVCKQFLIYVFPKKT